MEGELISSSSSSHQQDGNELPEGVQSLPAGREPLDCMEWLTNQDWLSYPIGRKVRVASEALKQASEARLIDHYDQCDQMIATLVPQYLRFLRLYRSAYEANPTNFWRNSDSVEFTREFILNLPFLLRREEWKEGNFNKWALLLCRDARRQRIHHQYQTDKDGDGEDLMRRAIDNAIEVLKPRFDEKRVDALKRTIETCPGSARTAAQWFRNVIRLCEFENLPRERLGEVVASKMSDVDFTINWFEDHGSLWRDKDLDALVDAFSRQFDKKSELQSAAADLVRWIRSGGTDRFVTKAHKVLAHMPARLRSSALVQHLLLAIWEEEMAERQRLQYKASTWPDILRQYCDQCKLMEGLAEVSTVLVQDKKRKICEPAVTYEDSGDTKRGAKRTRYGKTSKAKRKSQQTPQPDRKPQTLAKGRKWNDIVEEKSINHDVTCMARVRRDGTVVRCGGNHFASDHRRLWKSKNLLEPVEETKAKEGRAAPIRTKTVVFAERPLMQPLQTEVEQEPSFKRAATATQTDLELEDQDYLLEEQYMAETSTSKDTDYDYVSVCTAQYPDVDAKEKYSIPLLINGVRVIGIYDTGCHRTILSQRCAKKCKIDLVKIKQRFRTAARDVPLQIDSRSAKPVKIEAKGKPSFQRFLLIADIEDELYVGNDWDSCLGISVIGIPTTFPNELSGLDRMKLHEPTNSSNHLRSMWDASDLVSAKEYEEMMKIVEPALQENYQISQDSFCTHPLAEFPLEVDCDPIYERQRRIPETFKPAFEKAMHAWQLTKRIEKAPRNTPWNVPVHCVLKKDEQGRYQKDSNGDPVQVRPCFDFRTWNRNTRNYFSPIPNIAAIFSLMMGFIVASVIDLKSAYLQIKVRIEDRPKTTFTNPFDGVRWYFVGNPFGPKNTPMRFQYLMEAVLDGFDGVLVYLDDIIIVSKSYQEHAQMVKSVLKTLTQWNLRVSKEKIHLFYRRVRVLGHVLTPQGRSIDPVKAEIGSQFRRPTTGKQLARLIGFFGYLRDYIPLFARIVAPLEAIKFRRKITTAWKDEQENAYQCLVKSVTELPHLAHPDPQATLQLLTDWSQSAVSGILVQKVLKDQNMQLTEDQQHQLKQPISIDEMRLFASCAHPLFRLRFIGFYSKAMNRTQAKYPATRGELLAGMMSMQHFHAYLYGRKFFWLTDHKALARLLHKTPPNLYVANWLETILLYQFEASYMPGIHMVLPDTLSRIYSQSQIFSKEGGEESDISDGYLEKIRRLVNYQSEQLACRPLRIRYKTDESVAKAAKRFVPNIQRPNEAARDKAQGVSQKITPQTEEEQLNLVETYHEFAHVSGKSLHQVLWSLGYWWTKMREMCERVYKQCESCQRIGIHRVGYHPLRQIDAIYPGDHIGVDLFFLPIDIHGYIGGLVYVDYCTRFTLVRPIKSKLASYIAHKIAKIMQDHGLPKIFQSDRGREFVNEILEHLMKLLGIDKRLATAYSPRTQGTAESHVAKVKRIIQRTAGNEMARWSEFVPAAQLAVNVLTSRRKKSSPFVMYFNRPFSGFESFTNAESNLLTEEQLEEMLRYYKHVVIPALRDTERQYQLDTKNYHDARKRIRDDTYFSPGDRVSVWDPTTKQWEGIYTLGSRTKGGTYRVITKDGEEFPRNVGIDQLKLVERRNPTVRETETSENVYQVDDILSYDETTRKYEIKWRGYKETTWEPAENLHSPALIKRYWSRVAVRGGTPTQAKKKGSSGKRARPKRWKKKQNANLPSYVRITRRRVETSID